MNDLQVKLPKEMLLKI